MSQRPPERTSAWWRFLSDGDPDEAWDLDGGEDPWADAEVGPTALTEEQRAFLEALEDQPAVPRWNGGGVEAGTAEPPDDHPGALT